METYASLIMAVLLVRYVYAFIRHDRGKAWGFYCILNLTVWVLAQAVGGLAWLLYS